jgi:hypothetical protein
MPRRPRALAVEHATTTNGLQQSTHCGSTTSHLLPSTRGQSRSRPVRRSESEAVYVPPSSGNIGDLLYVGNGSIEARSFDAERRMLSGDGRTPCPSGERADAVSLHDVERIGGCARVHAVTRAVWGRA